MTAKENPEGEVSVFGIQGSAGELNDEAILPISTDTPWEIFTGQLSVSQLPPAMRDLWQVAFIAGANSRDAEVAQLNHTADRLYQEMCRRPAAPVIDLPSYGELERRRDAVYSQGAA
jgi:hypothetical protein